MYIQSRRNLLRNGAHGYDESDSMVGIRRGYFAGDGQAGAASYCPFPLRGRHITARAQRPLNGMPKQRFPKQGDDTQTNADEGAGRRLKVHVHQAATEASQYTNDVRGRWSDDGGQNNTTLTECEPSFRYTTEPNF
jgi:hypothetical protein